MKLADYSTRAGSPRRGAPWGIAPCRRACRVRPGAGTGAGGLRRPLRPRVLGLSRRGRGGGGARQGPRPVGNGGRAWRRRAAHGRRLRRGPGPGDPDPGRRGGRRNTERPQRLDGAAHGGRLQPGHGGARRPAGTRRRYRSPQQQRGHAAPHGRGSEPQPGGRAPPAEPWRRLLGPHRLRRRHSAHRRLQQGPEHVGPGPGPRRRPGKSTSPPTSGVRPCIPPRCTTPTRTCTGCCCGTAPTSPPRTAKA